jgi:hypothetical protein
MSVICTIEGRKVVLVLKARWCIDLESTEDQIVATFWLLKVKNLCTSDEQSRQQSVNAKDDLKTAPREGRRQHRRVSEPGSALVAFNDGKDKN